MSILSEIANRFSAVQVDELARMFSRIEGQHGRAGAAATSAEPERPASARKLPPLTGSMLLPIDPARIAGVLIALHDAQLRVRSRRGGLYEELGRRVRGFERNFREQASIVDALMARIAPAQPADASPAAATLQQTVLLQCPRAGRSAGRFRCLNRFAETVEVAIEGGAVCVLDAESRPVEGASALADPASFTLAPGAAMVVRLILDTRRADTRGIDALSAAFAVRMNAKPHARVWLEAELYDEGA